MAPSARNSRGAYTLLTELMIRRNEMPRQAQGKQSSARAGVADRSRLPRAGLRYMLQNDESIGHGRMNAQSMEFAA
jgi:hypothetical protein